MNVEVHLAVNLSQFNHKGKRRRNKEEEKMEEGKREGRKGER